MHLGSRAIALDGGQTAHQLGHLAKEWVRRHRHPPAQCRNGNVRLRLVDGHAAIRVIHQLGAWLQPQPVQYGAGFLLGFYAKLAGVEQCIQII